MDFVEVAVAVAVAAVVAADMDGDMVNSYFVREDADLVAPANFEPVEQADVV